MSGSDTVPIYSDHNRDCTDGQLNGAAQEDTSVTEGTVTYDIRFHAFLPGDMNPALMIVNIESQNGYYPGYPLIKRGLYYCCRMISAQKDTVFTKSHYEKIQKVCSIRICANPPKGRESSITRYRIAEEQLAGQVHENRNHYDLLSAVMICLGKGDDIRYTGIIKLLDVLLSESMDAGEKKQILETEFNIPMTEEIDEEVNGMGSLGEGIFLKGIKQGLEQGLEQGAEKTQLSFIRTLVDQEDWDLERAFATFHIPDESRASIREALQQERSGVI